MCVCVCVCVCVCSQASRSGATLSCDSSYCPDLSVLSLRYIRVSYHVNRESGGLVVNASDSGSRGLGFEPHLGRTVLCP